MKILANVSAGINISKADIDDEATEDKKKRGCKGFDGGLEGR